ncbi:MAG: PspC domain-containing protein [Lachnospiraceae bacterium]|nr:PspC domain-containing protein [Lachnospiraceae bacterium]MDD7148150.1 PspC domain-containing protein [Lachnospiraceae bacterium]MDY4068995.1 PspC domain-containing protein [Lachnospiraceae bacterium]
MDNGYKKLKRSRANKMLCGVCAGIGEYLNIDPTVVRILWAILSLSSVGMGVLIYFLAAVIVPDED